MYTRSAFWNSEHLIFNKQKRILFDLVSRTSSIFGLGNEVVVIIVLPDGEYYSILVVFIYTSSSQNIRGLFYRIEGKLSFVKRTDTSYFFLMKWNVCLDLSSRSFISVIFNHRDPSYLLRFKIFQTTCDVRKNW